MSKKLLLAAAVIACMATCSMAARELMGVGEIFIDDANDACGWLDGAGNPVTGGFGAGTLVIEGIQLSRNRRVFSCIIFYPPNAPTAPFIGFSFKTTGFNKLCTITNSVGSSVTTNSWVEIVQNTGLILLNCNYDSANSFPI